MTAGAILAGGQSRRFGSDKARERWKGRTYLACVAEAMRGAGLDPILAIGGVAEDLPDGARHVADRWPGQGPLGGVLTALLEVQGDVIVAACDMVRLAPGTFLRLVEFAGIEPVVVPVWQGHLQPLCALYRPACLVSIAEDFAAGERSLVNALGHLPLREVAFGPEDEAFANINTPEDAARYLGA
jgi:molybdopterin-guanine dinucleotide biosynthesis protein A